MGRLDSRIMKRLSMSSRSFHPPNEGFQVANRGWHGLPASLLAVFLAFPMAVSGSCPDLLEDFVWEEDFESGTTSGWESYPPFQDTAYDFTIYPGSFIDPSELRGTTFSGGEYYPPSGLTPPNTREGNSTYLMRGHKPEGTQGQSLGMWCKTPGLWSADNLTVSFDY